MGAWSVTKAKTATDCPWKFRQQYIDRIKMDPDDQGPVDDSKLRIGSAVHSYAEGVAKGKARDLIARRAIKAQKLVGDELDAFEAMKENVHEFETRIDAFKAKHNVTDDTAEKKIAINADLGPSDYWDDDTILRGAMDRRLVIGDRHKIIIDHKTGAVATLKYSREQLAAYTLMGMCQDPQIEMVHPVLHFVQEGELLWGDKEHRTSDFLSASNPIIKYINDAAETVESDDIHTGKYCDWCVYKAPCVEERKNRRKIPEGRYSARFVKD